MTLILPDQVRVSDPTPSDLTAHITAILPRQSISLAIDDRNFMKVGKFYFDKYYIGVAENGLAKIKAANLQDVEKAVAVACLFAARNPAWRQEIKWVDVKIGRSLEPVIPTTAAIVLVLFLIIIPVLPDSLREMFAQKGIDLNSATLWIIGAAGILALPNGFLTMINRRIEGRDRFQAGSIFLITLFMLFIALIKLVAC
jgi:hypothetical protein